MILNNTAIKNDYTIAELKSLPRERTQWLLDGLIPKSAITILSGPSESNKSTFARNLSLCIAHGATSFIGQALNLRRKRALIFCSEDDVNSMPILLEKQLAFEASDDLQARVRFVFEEEHYLRQIDRFLTSEPVDLVVVDTWADFVGNADFNALASVRRALNPLGKLATKHNTSIMLLHHFKKSAESGTNKNNLSGSQALEAKARQVLELREVAPGLRSLATSKSNYASHEEKSKEYILNLDADTMLFSVKEVRNTASENSQSKVYSDEEKQIFLTDIRVLKEEGLSHRKIHEALQVKYPGKRAPSTGSISEWLNEPLKKELNP